MKKAKIILLTGQSNAVGVGHCQYLPVHFSAQKVAEYSAGYPDVLINYYSHDKKSDGFVTTGLNCTELTKDTFGPEVGMAEVLTKRYPGQQIFIVKRRGKKFNSIIITGLDQFIMIFTAQFQFLQQRQSKFLELKHLLNLNKLRT